MPHDPNDSEATANGATLAADWQTIWQSEAAALAVDRELEEMRVALLALHAVIAPPTDRA